ncbi:MAG: hypothetical protein IPI07_06265 [Flavobacteriales bacterium]|nr:hypothetical protein [Flavobacteriales bacterium]
MVYDFDPNQQVMFRAATANGGDRGDGKHLANNADNTAESTPFRNNWRSGPLRFGR